MRYQGGEEEEIDIYGSVGTVELSASDVSGSIDQAAIGSSSPSMSSAAAAAVASVPVMEINEYAKYTSAAATTTAAFALEKKNDGCGYGYHGPGQRGVYVGEIAWWVSDQVLIDVFSQWGRVIDVKIFTEKLNGG